MIKPLLSIFGKQYTEQQSIEQNIIDIKKYYSDVYESLNNIQLELKLNTKKKYPIEVLKKHASFGG